VFLLSTTGALGTELGDLVARWWPLALIVIGAWYLVASVLPSGRAGDQSLAIPLGGATSASIRLKFGGGELSVGPAAADHLLEGEFERASAIHRITGDGQVEVEPADMVWPGVDRAPHWHVGVASSVPLDVDLQGWAGRVRMDFGATMLRRLHLVTGATDTRVTLPRAAGETAVQAEGGAASLVFEVPLGVAARIRSRVALGSTSVDEVRFPRTGSGTWESADYGAATNRILLEVSGGVGSVRVSSVA